MEEKILHQIRFGSFLKLMLCIFLSLGIFAGMLILIISLFGGNATANLGFFRAQGISAGIVSLVLAPIISCCVGVLYGLFAFLPFRFFLKAIGGIRIKLRLA